MRFHVCDYFVIYVVVLVFVFIIALRAMKILFSNTILILIFSVEAYRDDKNCNPCFYGNIIVRATHFCRTCEDPEPLCENCSTQHVRHKISRHHQICEDIKEFPYKDKNTE